MAIPCYNEVTTIGKVVDDFRKRLPDARIVVFDNDSDDGSPDVAAEAGAEVLSVPRRGKGHVIAHMLDTIDADIIVMVDGDDTYPAEASAELIAPVAAGEADMVVGARLADFLGGAFRPMHVVGNRLIRRLINTIFGTDLTDILSGYRAFSGDLARSIPVTAIGFEVETELTVQTLYHGYSIAEVQVPYRQRPPESFSKLRTGPDGARVLWTLFSLFRSVKPLTFFGLLAIFMAILSILAALPAVIQYSRSGLVYSWPLLGVGVGCGVISFTSLTLGILLHAINIRTKEIMAVLRRRRAER